MVIFLASFGKRIFLLFLEWISYNLSGEWEADFLVITLVSFGKRIFWLFLGWISYNFRGERRRIF